MFSGNSSQRARSHGGHYIILHLSLDGSFGNCLARVSRLLPCDVMRAPFLVQRAKEERVIILLVPGNDGKEMQEMGS